MEDGPNRGWSDEELRLRKGICRIGELCYQRSFIVGGDGNISARMSDGSILITPAGAMKGFLEPYHMARIDMQGKPLDEGPVASTEVGIHLVSYEERPEMKAMVHAHPPHAVATDHRRHRHADADHPRDHRDDRRHSDRALRNAGHARAARVDPRDPALLGHPHHAEPRFVSRSART